MGFSFALCGRRTIKQRHRYPANLGVALGVQQPFQGATRHPHELFLRPKA
jgi:hypothetical protein